jgi:hypothetical protein
MLALSLPGMIYASDQTNNNIVPVSSEGADRFAAIKQLHLESLSGSLPVYYSPQEVGRARSLQNLLSGELEFYGKVFDFRFAPVTLAVLNHEQWPHVSKDNPYGLPSMSDSQPWVFVMPSSWQQVTALPIPKETEATASVQRRVRQSGIPWNSIQTAAGDGIGTHEIGHSIVYQVGIRAQTHWFDEFLASYIGYAYLKERHPSQLLGSEIFWKMGLDAPHPFTTLSDFESRYDELATKYPQNYGWYQFTLEEHVIEVYRRQGVQFLTRVREEFPSNGLHLNSDQVLEKLERIDPGWKMWAAKVEGGKFSSSDGILE